MKRTLTLLLAASLVIGIQVTAQARTQEQPRAEGRWRGPCSDWWLGEYLTPAKFNADPDRGRQMMRRLIVCVFGVFAPGESVKALYVADRESSLYPWAANPSGCLGLFQHQVAYWAGRVHSYLWRGWFGPGVNWPVTPFDPRANAIAAARMVAAGGWGPWGG